jgi:hypothetical protein
MGLIPMNLHSLCGVLLQGGAFSLLLWHIKQLLNFADQIIVLVGNRAFEM